MSVEGVEGSQPLGMRDTRRRTVLKSTLGLGVGLPFFKVTAVRADDPKKARPQEGDRFVFLSGKRKGQVVKSEGLPLGGPQRRAYPTDPREERL